MRRIGIEIFYWMDNWSDDQIDVFPKAAACGFDGVEISFVSGPESIDVPRLRSELDRLGLDVFCATGLSPETDITSSDKTIREAGIAYLRKCLETAQQIGSPILGGVLYAPWLHIPQTEDLRPYRERSAAALREVAVIAEDLGVTLTLEVLNRFETYMFNTAADGLAFLQMIDQPSVKLQLDTYHMNMEEDHLANAIRAAGDALGHFHCAASNRKLPGKGHIDWAAINAALHDIDYQHGIVVETFPNPAVETGRTVNTWRPLVQDYDQEARQAVTFLKHQFAQAPDV